MNNNINVLELEIINRYKVVACEMLQHSFPHLRMSEIEEAVNHSIIKNCKNSEAVISNNYKNVEINTSLLELSEYILKREPIITPYGVMFKKSSEGPNPIANLLRKFMEGRNVFKKEMFKYPKGSEMFEKYNLLQLLAKIDANGFYGACGQYSCIYYNLNVAASVTTQGRSLISSAGLQFEMFLANNCKFGSLNEVITFIHNIKSENRKYDDSLILDRNISVEECFTQVILTCGFNYVPTMEDADIIFGILSTLKQEDINRIYYKNNLYEFMSNSSMEKALIYLLTTLESPYLDPNKAPDEIKVELDEFCDILMEYVYYSHQVIDRLDKYSNMYRSICIITDTDSTIISLDAWYRFVLDKVINIDMPIKHRKLELFNRYEIDEFGDKQIRPLLTKVEAPTDYSFYDEKVIYLEKSIDVLSVIPQEGLRHSIINILAYCLGKVINDYMERYTKNSNSYEDGKKCLIVMKNEFLFKRVLLVSSAKKNYASLQEIQEGHVVNPSKQLDIKGLMIGKASLPKTTQKALQNIVYEEILSAENVDQVKVLKELAKFENNIFNAIQNGSKEFYKPVRIKSMNSYDNPMGQQGIKASVVYNTLKESHMEMINLNERNSVDIIKVDINPKNIDKLKFEEPEIYEKVLALFEEKEFKKGITTIALPKNESIPKWLLEYVDYVTIISDNVKHLPIESLGIYRGLDMNSYTNILSL